MYDPRFELTCFETIDPDSKIEILEALLGALVLANLAYLRSHPDTPRLYASGVRYESEPPGRDNWQDIPRTLALKNGDCEDLACWRVAELIARDGRAARPLVRTVHWQGRVIYHVQVTGPGMREPEDPSVRLGMHPEVAEVVL